MYNRNHLTEDEISRRLIENQQPAESEGKYDDLFDSPPRPAAVLIPLYKDRDEWHVIYTRRNALLPEHSGQVAFPGGRADPGETEPEMTALREAYEEVGLEPRDVHILGRLNSFRTITNYMVTPVVGAIPWPYTFHPAIVEVDRVFSIPLIWLADPANFDIQERVLPPPYGPVPVIYYHPYDNEILWGASARFTLNLITTLDLG